MAIPFIELLKETLGDLESLNPEQVKKLMQEATSLMTQLQEQLALGDGEAKGAARQTAAEIQQYLEEQMKKVAERSGIDFQQLVALAQESRNEAVAELQKWAESRTALKKAPKKTSKNQLKGHYEHV